MHDEASLPVEDPRRVDRVRAHTAPGILDRIDRRTATRVFAAARGGPEAIERRLAEIDREWDVDRALFAASGILMGLTSARARKSWGWWALLRAQQAFLVMHAAIGWCPPLAVIRRLGLRTQKEIDTERAVLTELLHLLREEPDVGIDVVATYEVATESSPGTAARW